jgi:hypothetical protein
MNKGRVINFEWMRDYNHYSADEFNLLRTRLINAEIDKAAEDGCNIIVGIYLLDGFLQPKANLKDFLLHMHAIKDHAVSKGIEQIYIVSGQGETLEGLPFPYFFFDYNVRMIYNSYKHVSVPQFNRDNKKFLFLTGMPDRPNRIGLMSKFYDAGMLDRAEWTFFAPWTKTDSNWCREHLSHYTDEQYDKFLRECERSFDGRFETAKPFYGSYTSENTDIVWHDVVETDWVKAPTHIDSDVYRNTLFSIVSEGPNYWDDDNAFATEKSWRVFLHRHPFIFAGHPDQFQYLKNLGYRTFEGYLPIPDYHMIQDENKRLDAVVENTKYLLENREHDDAILIDTEHNYNVFFEHVTSQDKLLEKFKNEFGVPKDELEHYFEGLGYTQLIRRLPNG